MTHADDCDCDECAFPRATKQPTSLERFTWRLALIWAAFRMIANIIGKTTYGLLDLILYLLQIALYALTVTGTGAALYWIAKQAGAPIP